MWDMRYAVSPLRSSPLAQTVLTCSVVRWCRTRGRRLECSGLRRRPTAASAYPRRERALLSTSMLLTTHLSHPAPVRCVWCYSQTLHCCTVGFSASQVGAARSLSRAGSPHWAQINYELEIQNLTRRLRGPDQQAIGAEPSRTRRQSKSKGSRSSLRQPSVRQTGAGPAHEAVEVATPASQPDLPADAPTAAES
jgi:hypothetical protein